MTTTASGFVQEVGGVCASGLEIVEGYSRLLLPTNVAGDVESSRVRGQARAVHRGVVVVADYGTSSSPNASRASPRLHTRASAVPCGEQDSST